MLNFSCRCFLSILLSLIVSAVSEDTREALYFSQNVPRIMYDPKELAKLKLKDRQIDSPMATACPAKSKEETTFNELHSIGKNSLFVREIYAKKHSANEVDYKTCDYSYKLSQIYNANFDRFEFGFEIYYDKSKYEGTDFVDSIRSQYDMITNTHSVKNHLKTAISYVPTVPFLPRVSSFPGTSVIFQEAKIYLDDTRKIELGFIWIGSFFTKFNYRGNRVVQTTYNIILTTSTWKNRECDDYNLGNGYFRNIEIENLYRELYNEDNQRRMLEGVKLPTSKPDYEYMEAACESENKCFTKWLSIPSEQFHFTSIEPNSCSNLLTVPIWKSTIEKVLNKLDNFLYAVSLILGRLTIHSGVHGTLELPIESGRYQRTKKITLGKTDMPVPDIIYKLVKYQTSKCGKPENNQNADNEPKKVKCVTSLTAMIVVIHNNPYFDEKTDKVCTDLCTQLGWEEIQKINSAQDEPKSKYIYCCRTTDHEVRKKLGINYNFNEIEYYENVEFISVFNLKSVPEYNFETQRFDHHDVHEVVMHMYKVMFEGDKFDAEEYFREREASAEKKNGEPAPNDLTESSVVENDRHEIEDFQITEPENKGDEPDISELQFGDESESEKSSKQASENLNDLTRKGSRQPRSEQSDPETQVDNEGKIGNLVEEHAERKTDLSGKHGDEVEKTEIPPIKE